MVIGRILYGIGSGTVVIVQETILSQWFKGRSLAAVVALMLTVSRLASFCAQATVVPIANWTGWYGYGLWVRQLDMRLKIAELTRYNHTSFQLLSVSFPCLLPLSISGFFVLYRIQVFNAANNWK